MSFYKKMLLVIFLCISNTTISHPMLENFLEQIQSAYKPINREVDQEDREDPGDSECPICSEKLSDSCPEEYYRDDFFYEMGDENRITTLRCNHSFHYCCIKEWVNTQRSCPMCRAFIPGIDR